MPNIKSAMKRDAKSKELRAKNRADKTALKTVMKKFDAAVAGGDKTVAAESYKVAVKAVDKAACKGLIHKNNAAHKKSAMTVALNKMDWSQYHIKTLVLPDEGFLVAIYRTYGYANCGCPVRDNGGNRDVSRNASAMLSFAPHHVGNGFIRSACCTYCRS